MQFEGFKDKDFEEAKDLLLNPEDCKWELFASTDSVRVYRNCDVTTGLYEYKLYGNLKGVEPDLLSKVYWDIDYRKTWDTYVNDARVIKNVGPQELVYWQVNFPWPMRNRDYVYLREMRIFPVEATCNPLSSVYVCLTRSVFHPITSNEPPMSGESDNSAIQSALQDPVTNVPTDQEPIDSSNTWSSDLIPATVSGVVRVSSYIATLAFTSDNDGGSKLYMHYFDNPEGSIPTVVINYTAKQGVPSFVSTMQQAASNYDSYLKSKQQTNHNNDEEENDDEVDEEWADCENGDAETEPNQTSSIENEDWL